MTRTSTAPTMVLTQLDEHGEVPTGRPWFTTDKRVPFTVDHDHEVRAAGDWRTGHDDSRVCQVSGTELTPRMRHLFDVLESSREHEVEPDDDDGEWILEQRFNARLTCVRCGLVLEWRSGTRRAETAVTVDPTPLTVGHLLAQQTDITRYFAHLDTTWTVHLQHGERVGVIAWRRGPRGREYYEGRLRLQLDGAWSDDVVVEADTPAKVLRKLDRAYSGLLPTVQAV